MGAKFLLIFKELILNIRLSLRQVQHSTLNVLNVLSSLLLLTIIVLLFIEFSFILVDTTTIAVFTFHKWLLVYFFVDVLLRLFVERQTILRYFFLRPTDLIVLLPLFHFAGLLSFDLNYVVSQLLLLTVLLGRIGHLKLLLNWLRFRPTHILLLAFLFLIFIGSLLLSLPISVTSMDKLSYIDALFTACSAVCVTGLVVNDIGQDFSLFGQWVILFLIQIGGLGIMSFSVLVTLFLGRKFSHSDTMRLQESYATVNFKETVSAIAFIFKFTFLFEFLGTILLFLSWKTTDVSWTVTLYQAVFHSVSAFCNAGFSLFSDSLIAFQTDTSTIFVVAALIILGGIGFPVLFNLYQRYKSVAFVPLKLHTHLVIRVTFWLIIIGTAFIFFTERHHALDSLNTVDQLQVAFFQSVTTRTAGFNTIDIGVFHSSTIMIMIIWMIIGASPGSTGGGLKTTTFGILVISFWNILRSSFRFDFLRKTIDSQSVLKAFTSLFTILFLICLFSFMLFSSESLPASKVFFEVVSAFSTVGLSQGVTAELSAYGKAMIMLVMFIGRIGPFVFLYAFFSQKVYKPYAYSVEKVSIV